MGGGIGQYALYRAEDGSLCLFSLVIPAGAQTPIHDHLAWGLIGVYRGVQDETVYRRLDDGRDESKATLEIARQQTVKHGEFYTLLPPLDDIHYVKTVSDTPSISIHLLANDTACVTRHRFDAASGIVTPFRSGYSNANCPDNRPIDNRNRSDNPNLQSPDSSRYADPASCVVGSTMRPSSSSRD